MARGQKEGKEGGPKKIGSLFEVYKKRLRAPESSVIHEAQEVILDVTHIHVSVTELTFSPHTKVLTIHLRGPKKSEVLLHQNDIILHLKGRLGVKNAPVALV